MAHFVRNYRRAINPPYSKLDLPAIFLTILFLLTLVFSLMYLKIQQDPRGRAQEPALTNTLEKAPEAEFVANELLVKVKKTSRGQIKINSPTDTGIASLNQINRQFGVQKFERVAVAGVNSDTSSELFAWYKATLPGNHDRMTAKLESTLTRLDPANPAASVLQRLIDRYQSDSSVETAGVNGIGHIMTVPNDPYYSSSGSWGQTYDDMWALKKINMTTAWDQTTGSANMVVADIDTGADRNHPDLAANMWVNTKEIPSNGIDDDKNGFIDDYYGWDFANKDNDPMDDMGHGTHTAGTIGAVGNNGIGVVGVNWVSKIMAVKALDSGGALTWENAAKALQYAADMGAKVSNNSWGGNPYGLPGAQITDDAVKYEHDKGMVTVTAAGNSNGDVMGTYLGKVWYTTPASSQYALTVSASDHNDLRSDFSNFGEKVDVDAPGGESGGSGCPQGTTSQTILSLKAANTDMYNCAVQAGAMIVGNQYYRSRGTSMAAPHVAGLAALLLARNPSLTNEEIRQIIRSGADDLGTPGRDRFFGFGRINAGKSMTLAANHILAPAITTPSSNNIKVAGKVPVYGSMPGPNFASYKLEYSADEAPKSWNLITSSTTQLTTDGLLGTFDTGTLPDGVNILKLTATDTAGKTYQFESFRLTVDNFDAVITSPAINATVTGTITITGTAQAKNGVPFGNYTLDYSRDLTNWSSTGITLANNGSQPVINGTLGSLTTSSLTAGSSYYLRLKVNTPDGRYDTTKVTIFSGSTIPTTTSTVASPTPTRTVVTPVPTSVIATSTPSPLPTTVSDTLPPSVILTSPLNGIVVSRRSTMTIQASASDNVGVQRVEFYINGTLTCTDTSAPYACTWNIPGGKANATYILKATAIDTSSNSSSSTVTVKAK